MKKAGLMLGLLLVSLGLPGCNTVAGAGKDIQRAGDRITGAAKG